MDWLDILKNLVVFTVGSGFITYLAKHLFENYLQRKLEDYRSNLDRQSDEYRHRLELISQENQIRFSKLHGDRAEVIVNLFKKLVKMDQSFRAYMGPIIVGGAPDKPTRQETAINAANDFLKFFFDNEIYFDNALCETIKEINQLYLDAWYGYNVYDDEAALRDAQFDKEFRKERSEAFKKAWEIIEKKIPTVKKNLEDQFRKLLGVI